MDYRGMTWELVTVTGHDGDGIEAYVARPSGGGAHPGVVVTISFDHPGS